MYKSIQASRAIAAILVVLCHLGGAIGSEKYFGVGAFTIPFSFGHAGVEFFFVLSGFIIYTAHHSDIGRPRNLGRYVWNRLVRIYPSYLIIFIAILSFSIAVPELRNSIPHDPYVLAKTLLLIPQDKNVVGGTGAPVIIVAWTLQYEMFFYFFFALMILNKWASMVVGVLIVLVFGIYFHNPPDRFFLSFLAQDYIALFVMGVLVAAGYHSGKMVPKRPFLFVVIGVAVFLSTAIDEVIQFDKLVEWRTLLYGLSSAIFIFGLVTSEDRGRIYGKQRWLQVLGASSYALYLMHYPLISFLCKATVAMGVVSYGIVGALFSYIFILPTCLIAAMIFHQLLEKPLVLCLKKHSPFFKNRN